ncbi:hypothetical protein FFY77_19760 [Xanthomonas translucens pv. translucens]|uniref:hypothetical protein n=1 Tax=Xanthomonas campestris pv. translucens TaxID=343 RepID=UPI001296CB97|nr:hypothetical protein [Xanthomonas translucens]MQS43802.1 hypothetical protein [Xanthomonas translucens pv. translucens]
MQSNQDTDHAAGVGQRPTRLARSAVLTLALLAGSASAQQDALQVATSTTYALGTPEWRQLRDWLVQHPATMQGKRVGDPAQLGAVTLAYSATRPATTRTVPQPLPLPATGAPGDSIAIASCAQGYLQSWHYVPDESPQHRWDLQSYSLKLTAACPGGASQG